MVRYPQVIVFLMLGLVQASASFDVQRVPTPQDMVAIRKMGWSAAADDLEMKLAGV